MAKVTIDNFDKAVKKILDEYEGTVLTHAGEITEKIGREGVKMLKNASSQYEAKGVYRKSWKMAVERERLRSSITIYSTTPYIPHLLEYGYAKRNGGRVEPKPHIKPVEEKLIEQFVTTMEAAL